jgi:glycosyltransferase involved in cell wall biosynthesis
MGRDEACALSAVVPCYNEEPVLKHLHRRLSAACRAVVGDDYEIVLVNDGSHDATWPLIKALSEEDPHIVGVDLSRNHGQQLALTAGLSVCRGDRVLVIDADLQDPPELLGDMMTLMDRGADVVYGQRRSRAGETWVKTATARWFYWVLRYLSDVDIPADTGDFRLVSRRVLDQLRAMPENYRFFRGMISWLGFTQVPILYDRDERVAGVTKYSYAKMLHFAVDAITGFSTRPLRIATHLGLLLAALSMIMIVWIFYTWLVHDVVRGWASVMTVILVLGSANMLLLGVLGEYMGRLYMQSKQRPLFIIREVACDALARRAAKPTVPPRSVAGPRS